MTRSRSLDHDLTALGVTFTTSAFERQFYTHELIALPHWVKLLFATMPLAIVKPVSTEEVCSVLRYCSNAHIPVVPRGGGTLGPLGAVPKKGGIVLDLTGLVTPVECDLSREIAHVPAGLTCLKLDRILRKHWMTLKSYPSSAPSATIGGWIMGSGLGIGSLAYGPVFGHIRGCEVVLADGSRRSFSTQEGAEWIYKSEGRLAVLTSVILRVRKVPEGALRYLVSFRDRAQLFEFVRTVVTGPALPYSVEILDASYVALVTKAGYGVDPFDGDGGVVLVTYEGERDAIAGVDTFLRREARLANGLMEDEGEAEWENRFKMWRVKRTVPTMLPIGIYLPISSLAGFYEKVAEVRKRPIAFFGQ